MKTISFWKFKKIFKKLKNVNITMEETKLEDGTIEVEIVVTGIYQKEK